MQFGGQYMSRMRDLLIKRRSEVTPLIHWDFSGKSNADAGTIVEDLTGNGYDLELKNFAFDNVSGYNGYPTDFRKWYTKEATTGDNFEITSKENILKVKGTFTSTGYVVSTIAANTISVNQIVVKVTGLKENQFIRFSNESGEIILYQILKNGISVIDTTNYEVHPGWSLGLYFYSGDITQSTNMDATIEIFPLYPDQLVFDDSLAKTIKGLYFPKSRGFTIIYNRVIIDDNQRNVLFGKTLDYENNPDGAYIIIEDNRSAATNVYRIVSYGVISDIDDVLDRNQNIVWCTKNNYNGLKPISEKLTSEDIDKDVLQIGSYFYNSTSGNGHFAIREVYVFDRDLTQSQIEKFISDNMIPLPEVYYDVEKQGTLNEHTTKDKLIDFSGNENHGTLHNFTFDESNGWGYYPLDTVPCDKRASGNTVVINGNSTGVIGYNQRLNVNAENFTQDVVIPEFRVKVTGLSAIKEIQPKATIGFVNVFINDGGVNTSHYYSVAGIADGRIHEDGIYTIPSYTVQFSNKQDITSLVRLCDLFYWDITNDGSVNITVEFLPDEGDCLRFKGTKGIAGTYIDNIYDTGFKTIFLLVDNDDVINSGYFYDQRKNESEGNYHFGLYYGSNTYIAYNYRNSGITYINGIINTTIGSGTLQGKRCITIVDDAVDNTNSQSPVISGQTVHDYTSNMKLYKFLGFKEALSEKQIKMVIEKYGLQVD